MLVLTIFVSYYASITFFTHAHVVNGVTIVHSHPYKKTEEGKPAHEHSTTTVQLISQLSHYTTTGDFPEITVSYNPVSCITLQTGISEDLYLPELIGSALLRGPPCGINSSHASHRAAI